MDKLRLVLCSVFIFIAIVISGSKVYAKNGIINSVVISDSKNYGYEIKLNTDKKAFYSQKNLSDDKIILEVKGLTVSQKTETIYQNASNLEHVIIKPILNGTVIEISGKNAAKSSLVSPNGIAKAPAHTPLKIFSAILIGAALLMLKRRKQNKFSTKISVADEENKILKVAFERKGGLIARSTGIKRMPIQPANVRKVSFEETSTIRELNLK
ncbi:MAG: hypothetical protein K6A44_03490 [bacterium]|nr:hypothetical protein [bacterium]